MSFKEKLSDARSRFANRPILAAILILLVGILLGMVIRRGDGPPAPQSASLQPTHSGHEQDQATMWTCSMHAQIHSDKPGKCPLCGMDLIPVQRQTTGGLRTLTVSPAARALMNIQTVPVERKFVSAVVRMAGKVEYDETRRGYIAAWVPGRLDRLYVDYTGVAVKKGLLDKLGESIGIPILGKEKSTSSGTTTETTTQPESTTQQQETTQQPKSEPKSVEDALKESLIDLLPF